MSQGKNQAKPVCPVWHSLSVSEIEQILDGLAKQEGVNVLRSYTPQKWLLIFFGQFKSPLVGILLLAAFLSYLIGDRFDTLAILIIVVLNAGLGFVQEWKADTALEKLKNKLSPVCRILRNGGITEVSSQDITYGDRVFLDPGSIVPADLRLVEISDLQVDESPLTGESHAILKDVGPIQPDAPLPMRRNMAFTGTHVVSGHGEGLVVSIGENTEFGKIAALTGEIREGETDLQKQLADLAKQLGALALVISALVFAIGLISGKEVIRMAMTGISLAVAAVPEGLPAVVTITLALGMNIMAKKKALLRHLQAAETLGAISVICTDKTGTLTTNEMTAQRVWLPHREITVSGAGYNPEGGFFDDGIPMDPQFDPDLMALLDTGRKCNHSSFEKKNGGWVAKGSPTEAALMVLAAKAGLKFLSFCIVRERSFDSSRKCMSVLEKKDDAFIAHVKGAPETVIQKCTHYLLHGNAVDMTDSIKQEIQQAYLALSESGMRALSLARKQMESANEPMEEGLVFLGLVGLIDPPRPEVRQALHAARNADIKVILITGDSPETALAVANQVGMNAAKAITGTALMSMNDLALSELLQTDVLFARTVPQDKYRIVRILQEQGALVAMTGDGINDAPALKQADIGIAMGIRGTDVARAASDIVLVDDNFATIIAAIEEGRRQYANIKKFVYFLVCHSIGEVSAVFINILMDAPLILLPIQLLWINIATDSVTALSLSVEKPEANIMKERPRDLKSNLLERASLAPLALMGLYAGVVTIVLFHVNLPVSLPYANTIAFTTIVITAQTLVFNFRQFSAPISQIGWFSNPWLIAAVASMLLLQAAAVYCPPLQYILHTVPLDLKDVAIIFGLSLPLWLVPEFFKFMRSRGI